MKFSFEREYLSQAELKDLPQDNKPVVIFMGRSNVGKSSFLNRIAGESLARTSNTPGRTRGIVLFRSPEWFLADFPGYGFSKTQDKARPELVSKFLQWKNHHIRCVLFLIDVRRGVGPSDELAYTFLTKHVPDVRVCIVLTKGDKLFKKHDKEKIEAYETQWALDNHIKVDRVKLISNNWEASWKNMRLVIEEYLKGI